MISKSRLNVHGFAPSASSAVRQAGDLDVYAVSDFIRHQSNVHTLFCVPNVPILYLITGIPNATSFDYLDPIIDPEVSKTLISQLDQKRPELVVIHDGLKFWDKYEYGHQFGVDVDAYIRLHYTKEVFRIGDYRILRRSAV